MAKVNDVTAWLQANQHKFVPPVCNECMFREQLKVFFIGGPNQRADYHNNNGEELFYQLRGDMCLKVVERGTFRDVHIRQGQLFLLPARVPHSPQRQADTVGMVIERTRAAHEHDGLRYYIEEGSQTPLFERWFHLTDVVKDLPPVIAAYFASEEHRTGRPTATSVQKTQYAFGPDANVELMAPVCLDSLIAEHRQQIDIAGSAQVFGPPAFATQVTVYGAGQHHIHTTNPDQETFVWLYEGAAQLIVNDETSALQGHVMALIPPAANAQVDVAKDGLCLTVQMNTPGLQLL